MSIVQTSAVLVILIATFSASGLAGCGSGSSQPQSIASEERVGQIVEMRKIFDKVGGKWESLSAEDRAEFTRLAGDDAKAQAMWKTMSNPMGAAPGQ